MAAKTTTRVKYVKVDDPDGDYVDARFDVMLDGVKVGQVTRNVERVETARSAMSTSRIGSFREATLWEAEGTAIRKDGSRYPYRSYIEYTSRVDAVIDFLRARGMEYGEAATAVGKRGL